MIIAFILFVILGLAFGYAAPGPAALIALALPLLLILGALAIYGAEADIVVKAIVALALTAGGMIVGKAIDKAGSEGRTA